MAGITIAFLGQCHTAGYPGVPPDKTFPQVLQRDIEANRPGTKISLIVEEYQHPADLRSAADKALLAHPSVVVIEVVGWLAIKGDSPVDLTRLPRPIRSAYDRVRHFRHISQTLVSKIPGGASLIYTIQEKAFKSAARVLKPLIPRRGRTTLEEYEFFVNDAASHIQSGTGAAVVIQGPGAPNLDLNAAALASDAIDRYRLVDQMAARVAAANAALYVSRWDTVAGKFYRPGSIRPSAGGHSIWGHLLAEQLMAAGLV